MTRDRDYIVRCTELLRDSPDPMWVRLRQLLGERGISPFTTIVATSFPDDTAFEFGVLVTSDYRVYQFGLDYLHKSVDQAVLTEWVDLTERHASTKYSEDVAEALEYLAESQGRAAYLTMHCSGRRPRRAVRPGPCPAPLSFTR